MTAWALSAEGRLSGRVGFDNLVEVRAAGEARIQEGETRRIAFDCSGLSEANSVAVALLIAWQRAAERCGKTVVFRGASQDLRNIAEFSGLNEMLAFVFADDEQGK